MIPSPCDEGRRLRTGKISFRTPVEATFKKQFSRQLDYCRIPLFNPFKIGSRYVNYFSDYFSRCGRQVGNMNPKICEMPNTVVQSRGECTSHVHFSPFGESATYKMAADKALLANQPNGSGRTYPLMTQQHSPRDYLSRTFSFCSNSSRLFLVKARSNLLKCVNFIPFKPIISKNYDCQTRKLFHQYLKLIYECTLQSSHCRQSRDVVFLVVESSLQNFITTLNFIALT